MSGDQIIELFILFLCLRGTVKNEWEWFEMRGALEH